MGGATGGGALGRLAARIPLAASLQGYDRQRLRGDLTAGLTVAVMLIPQGMAYAMLAGLPPIVGLYAVTLPLAVYALFGTSRELAVGPVALVSLMVAAAVGGMAEAGSAAYLGLAILLAALVGVIQLGMGVFRLGFVVNWLSHPVISGFTSAAAVIIALSQLKHLLGVSIPRSGHLHEILIATARELPGLNPITLALGGAAILVLVLLKRRWPRFPAAVVVVAATTGLTAALRLDEYGVAVVGDVPAGLPGLGLPALGLSAILELTPTALAIALVGFVESFSVAKAIARKRRYEVDANRELVGLGASNLAASLVGAFPVTGGFSRTAVNAQAGARTGLASLFTAAFMALALLFLTDLFFFLPQAVLAAVIIVAVASLVDVAEVRHLFHVKRSDMGLLLVTFFATLGLGIEPGLVIGVGASLFLVIYRISHPHVAVLGRVPGGHTYRSIERFPDAVQTPGVLALRIDAQFYFGNVSFLRETLARLVAEAPKPLRAIVIEAASINQLDSSADAALQDLVREYREHGIEIYLANVRAPVREVMERSGLADLLGSSCFAWSVHAAVKAAAARRGTAGSGDDGEEAEAPEPRRGRGRSEETKPEPRVAVGQG